MVHLNFISLIVLVSWTIDSILCHSLKQEYETACQPWWKTSSESWDIHISLSLWQYTNIGFHFWNILITLNTLAGFVIIAITMNTFDMLCETSVSIQAHMALWHTWSANSTVLTNKTQQTVTLCCMNLLICWTDHCSLSTIQLTVKCHK